MSRNPAPPTGPAPAPSAGTLLALRVIVVICLLGAAGIQVLILQAAVRGLPGPGPLMLGVLLLVVLGIACLQVIGLCVLRLLALIRRGAVYSAAALRPRELAVGAVLVGAAVLLALAVLATIANHTTHGDEVAPGVVGLLCGFSLVGVGVGLLLRIDRDLWAQTLDRLAAPAVLSGAEGAPGTMIA